MKAQTMLLRSWACGPDRVIRHDGGLISAAHPNIQTMHLAMCFLLAILEIWYLVNAFEGMEYRFVPAHFG
jgi:hypothetical protein